MSKIVKIIGREIIDSRGNPTVEAEVQVKLKLQTNNAPGWVHCRSNSFYFAWRFW